MRQLQQTSGQDRLERARGIGAIGSLCGGCLVDRQRRRCEHALQVVGEDLGSEVLLERQVRQAGGRFQSQSVLDAFEGFLHAPALMIERAELRRGIALGIEQRGHQDAHVSSGRPVTDQAHARRCAVDLIGGRIGGAGCCESHEGFAMAAAQELPNAVPSGGIHTHAEVAPGLAQGRGHGVAWQAAIEHEQVVVRLHRVERLEQHLPFGTIGQMQAGMQGQLRAGKEQSEGVVVRAQMGAGTGGHLQARTIGSDHAQTVPAMRINQRLRKAEQMIVRLRERHPGKAHAGFAEGLRADAARADGLSIDLGKQTIEFGLDRSAHAADHHRQQAWQGQFALAGEGGRLDPDLFNQVGRMQEASELRKERRVIEYSSS
jgi:hypothetical protein